MRLKLLFLSIFIFAASFGYVNAQAPGTNFWKLVSANTLQPIVNTWNLKVPALANQTCLGTDSTGLFGAGTCSGGGGVTGGTAGMLATWVNSTTLTASSTPTATAYYASSTTATSTLEGSLIVNSFLYVDQATDRVGISTSTPQRKLVVSVTSSGGAGTAALDGIQIADTSGGGAWDLVNPFATLSLASGDSSGPLAEDRIRIGAVADSVTNNATRLGFFMTGTTPGGWFEGVTFGSGGNVGVGTTSPYAKLSVAGQTVAQNFTATSSSATSTFSGGFFVGTTTIPAIQYGRHTGTVLLGQGTTTALMSFLSTGDIKVKVGSNRAFGTSTLTTGTVTVSNTLVAADSLFQLTNCVAGGTLGILSVGTRTAGTSFVINSSSALDTSTVCWEIKQPAY